jgi:hypothetical protein
VRLFRPGQMNPEHVWCIKLKGPNVEDCLDRIVIHCNMDDDTTAMVRWCPVYSVLLHSTALTITAHGTFTGAVLRYSYAVTALFLLPFQKMRLKDTSD